MPYSDWSVGKQSWFLSQHSIHKPGLTRQGASWNIARSCNIPWIILSNRILCSNKVTHFPYYVLDLRRALRTGNLELKALPIGILCTSKATHIHNLVWDFMIVFRTQKWQPCWMEFYVLAMQPTFTIWSGTLQEHSELRTYSLARCNLMF